jgi:hypothetical protein
VSDAAVEHAKRYEENRVDASNILVERGAEHDLIIQSVSGERERVIKVIGLAAAWSSRGVALDVRQAEAARAHGDLFWLYVVEYATDPDKATVFAIANPVKRATEFLFDAGWQAAVETASRVVDPAVGMHLHKGDVHLGLIEAVESLQAAVTGEPPMIRLRLRTEKGESIRVTYSPSRHVVTRDQ